MYINPSVFLDNRNLYLIYTYNKYIYIQDTKVNDVDDNFCSAMQLEPNSSI